MHTHACPLYALSKLIGLEFTESGVSLAPKLPLSSFKFESPLLGMSKSARGYEGWYHPSAHGTYLIRLKVPAEAAKGLSRLEVNGKKINARLVDEAFEMRGHGGGQTPLRWSVSRG
jgi:hypothetical protein